MPEPSFPTPCTHRAHRLTDIPPNAICPECGEPVGNKLAALSPKPAPRCKRCAYVLEGLPTPGDCPECGTRFDLSNPATYSINPPFIGWKFWLPGLATAAAGGMVSLLVGVFGFQSFGAAIWIGVPFFAGAILGYRFRSKLLVNILLTIALIIILVMTVMGSGLGGVFCGLVICLISIGPVLLGTGLGVLTRTTMKSSGFSQRSYLPVLFFVGASLLWSYLEGPPPPRPAESITTELTLHATPHEAWDSIMFYEDVTHEPPWILKVGLARPLRTQGSSRSVGDIKRCLYNKGPITKRITRLEPNKLLEFEVIEQRIGYERDVRLVGGSFAFEAQPDGTTKVLVTTRYEPHLAPRLAWRPAEAYAVHTLHTYVLEGMRRRAEDAHAPTPTAATSQPPP